MGGDGAGCFVSSQCPKLPQSTTGGVPFRTPALSRLPLLPASAGDAPSGALIGCRVARQRPRGRGRPAPGRKRPPEPARREAPPGATHRWKFLPSSRTTTQQWGKQVSSASKSRTYSNLLLAMAAPRLRQRPQRAEVAAEMLRSRTWPAAHIPALAAGGAGELRPGSSGFRRGRSSSPEAGVSVARPPTPELCLPRLKAVNQCSP